MATDARAIRKPEATHPDWEKVKEWAKATLTKERIADVFVCASTVTILGMVLHMLHTALENGMVVGTTPF